MTNFEGKIERMNQNEYLRYALAAKKNLVKCRPLVHTFDINAGLYERVNATKILIGDIILANYGNAKMKVSKSVELIVDDIELHYLNEEWSRFYDKLPDGCDILPEHSKYTLYCFPTDVFHCDFSEFVMNDLLHDTKIFRLKSNCY